MREELGRELLDTGASEAFAVADHQLAHSYVNDREYLPKIQALLEQVNIHRKPGYDPAELLIDPALKLPKAKIAATLLKKQLGFRTLMDVIPLDATVVRGSHGHIPAANADRPLLISRRSEILSDGILPAVDVCQILLNHLQSERK